jgi:peptidoglycan/xylan/chitin deacetylase (PgdA/CDA1 family)
VQRVVGVLAAIAGAIVVLLLPIPWWAVVAIYAVAAGIGLDQCFRRIPAFDPLGRVRWRLPAGRGRKRCAVTFDDGPSPATPTVLDILASEGVPATFFFVGGNAERYPDAVRRAAAEGHAIGLHGKDHRKLTGASAGEVDRQLDGVKAVLERIGVTPAPVYRTPHGFKSRGVFDAARRRGLALWAWSRGVWDTDRPDPAILVRRATRVARDGMVLLLHDGHDDEADPDVRSMVGALPGILAELKRRGFEFVRLTDAL